MENIEIRNLKLEDFEGVIRIVCQYWDKMDTLVIHPREYWIPDSLYLTLLSQGISPFLLP